MENACFVHVNGAPSIYVLYTVRAYASNHCVLSIYLSIFYIYNVKYSTVQCKIHGNMHKNKFHSPASNLLYRKGNKRHTKNDKNNMRMYTPYSVYCRGKKGNIYMFVYVHEVLCAHNTLCIQSTKGKTLNLAMLLACV